VSTKPSPLNAKAIIERMTKLVAAHDRIAAAAAAKVKASAATSAASGNAGANSRTP